MSFSANYPTTAPSLLLDFANSNAVDPRVTFTRASTATYFDSIGTLQSAAINAPRLDYNPSTLAAQGLLIEEQRTNSIRNNTMVGAVAGTPGTAPTNWTVQINTTTGLTTQVVGTGTESGVTYIDLRVSGTASGAGSLDVFFENATTVPALTGQTWTGAIYTKLQSGSLTGISSPTFRLYEYTSGVVFVVAQIGAIATPTTAGLATQRTTATLTTTGGATTASIRPLINYAIANGVAIDITLRVGLPQLELGAFATSVIPTSTVAVTRSADVASVNTLSPWYNATAGSLYAEFTASANANTVYAALSTGAMGQNSFYFDNDSGLIRNVVFSSSSSQAAMSTGAIGTVGAINKVAGAYTVNDFAVSRNGGASVTDTSGAVPLTMSQLDIGRNPNAVASTYVNGYLRRITYFPVRLSNANLQAITT